MLLAQLTDTHIKADGGTACGRVDTAAFLAAAVRHVNQFRPAVDAVVVTGDLTDRGGPEEYAALRDLLGELMAPWFVLPGNHDDRRNLLDAFADHGYLAQCRDFVHYAIEDFPIRLVGLDTTVPGQPHGWLCPDRLSWLDAKLAAEPGKPTMVFQHHPPFDTGIRFMDVQRLENGDEEFEVVARHAQVRHVACGHVHRAAETVIRSIGVSIAPNAAHSVSLDLAGDGPGTFVMEPPAIRLFRIGDDGRVTSHLSFVERSDGPYPFRAEKGALID
jgi:3',5'-cyclic AMP phosphodiesterase CpdA